MLQLYHVLIFKRMRISLFSCLLMKKTDRGKPQEAYVLDKIMLKSVLERFSSFTAVFVLNFKEIFEKYY